MKKLFLAAGIVAIIALVIVGHKIFSRPHSAPMQTGTTFPVASTSQVESSLQSGGVSFRNFLNDEDTREDPVNPGYFYAGYQTYGNTATQNPPYLVEYIAATQYFNITITQEPISTNRVVAERYLEQKLNLSQGQMCKLDYAVYVPVGVNVSFAGTDLRFSFCPDAVALP